MSCNISIPLQRIIDDVAEALSEGFIKSDNAILINAVFKDATLRGEVVLDSVARESLCAILSECGFNEEELAWLTSTTKKAYPTYVSMVADRDNLVPGSFAEVLADPDEDLNGNYAYNGTTFAFTPHNPGKGSEFDEVLPIVYSVESAKSSEFGEVVTAVRTVTHSGTGGGAIYKRSTQSETSTYPDLAYFISADGAYWLLDEDRPDPSMFGGKPAARMSDLTHVQAVDGTAVLTAARRYALLRKTPLYITGYYMWVGNLIPESGERFIGNGRTNCGIQTRTDGPTYQAGFKIVNNNNVVVGMELQAYLYTAKPTTGGTGMVGVSLLIGNYHDGTLPVPRGYYIDDVLLTRKDNETDHISYNGIAMQVSGGANVGYLGVIEISGRHTVAYMSHWTGESASISIGSSQTIHPRNFTIDKLIVSSHVDTLVTLSSVANLTINSVHAVSCANVLTVLAGDEADNFNIGEPNVGADVHFGDLVVNNVTTNGKTGFTDALGITSLATSKFQLENGAAKQQQLRISMTIDNLTINTTDPLLVYGIDLFYFYGTFHVKNARITGFKYPFRAAKSRGDINVNFEYTDGACIIKDSDATLSGCFSLKDRYTKPYPNPWAVLVDASPFEVGVNSHLREQTFWTVPTGLPERIERGGVVEITGVMGGKVQTVRYVSDRFVPAGATKVDIGVIFADNANTATLRYVGKCDVKIYPRKMTGSHVGVYAKYGHTTIRGDIAAGRYNVHAYGPNTIVDYKISSNVAGDYRLEGSTTSLYDLFVEAGATAIASGTLGGGRITETGIYRSIGGIASGDRCKLHIHNAMVVDKTRVVDLVAHNIECTVSGSFTALGKPYTIVDAYGLEQSGINSSGAFVRNPDGSMECWLRNITIGATRPHVWTFPAPFIDTANTVGYAISTSTTASRVPSMITTSATQASVVLESNDPAVGVVPDTAGMSLFAKGFWKLPT